MNLEILHTTPSPFAPSFHLLGSSLPISPISGEFARRRGDPFPHRLRWRAERQCGWPPISGPPPATEEWERKISGQFLNKVFVVVRKSSIKFREGVAKEAESGKNSAVTSKIGVPHVRAFFSDIKAWSADAGRNLFAYSRPLLGCEPHQSLKSTSIGSMRASQA